MNSYGKSINSFNEIAFYQKKEQLEETIKDEIEKMSKEYILGVDEEEFISFLNDKYLIEPLSIDFDSELFDEPKVLHERIEDRFFSHRSSQEVYEFTVRFNYTGSSDVFYIRPSSGTMTSNEINISEYNNTVSFSFKLYNKDPEEFKSEKNSARVRAFANLSNANNDVQGWNNSIPGIVRSFFYSRKDKLIKENDFFAAINVKVNENTTSVFTTPVIAKKVIPKPIVSTNKEFSSEPTMSKEMYLDILKVIYDLGKSMERKPSTYKGKNEEGIRDQFLLVLETRYDSTTASGETFNRGGKTDIILKYSNDGSNLFVAECKFWHGASEFHKAISQLFDRYLTWRDSKVALLIFVRNIDFSSVLETMTSAVKTHPYFVKQAGNRGETSFSYNFRLPQDKNKVVYLEIIAFHYDK